MSYASFTSSLPYDRREFEEAVALFEQAWHAGQEPPLADYLPGEGPLRGALLAELAMIDMEFRQARGQACSWADYQRRFPELGSTKHDPATDVRTTQTHAIDSTTDPARSSAAATPTIRQSFGRYRVLKELGQGAMGAVYLAHDTQLDRQVALKVPKFVGDEAADSTARFYREARASATLRHTNICPVFDVGEIDGQHYITMAYIEGRPLKEYIRGKLRPGQRQAAAVIRKLALGMAEAHAQGVIHRDLKPANVMIDSHGEPVIMDFGLARRSSAMQSKSTQEGTLLGTPAYMSPEQVDADPKRIGPASDIYSLGVILYELLTGELPFTGDLMTVLNKIGVEDPPPPSSLLNDLDPRLEAICLKMMARRRRDRYGSMAETARALSGFLKSSGGNATEEVFLGNALTELLSAPPAPAKEESPGAHDRRATETFDPYLTWLEIPANRRPPTHYDLLGLPAFEEDAQHIHQAAMQRTAQVRRYQLGQHAAEVTRLLGELSLAFDCLTHAERKQAYDAQLRTQMSPQSAPDQRSLVASFPAIQWEPTSSPRLISYPRHKLTRRLPQRQLVALGAGIAGVALLLLTVTLLVRVGEVDVQVIIDDPQISVRFAEGTITFEGSGEPIRLKPGEHKFIVERGGLVLETDRFVVRKEGKNILQVSRLDGKVAIVKNGDPAAGGVAKVTVPETKPPEIAPQPKENAPASLPAPIQPPAPPAKQPPAVEQPPPDPPAPVAKPPVPRFELDFDGDDDYVDLGNWALPAGPITIEVWVTPMHAKDAAVLWFGSPRWLSLEIVDKRWTMSSLGGDKLVRSSAASDVAIKRRVHIAGTWSGKYKTELFVDGQPQPDVFAGPVDLPWKAEAAAYIGRKHGDEPRHFSGTVEGVRISSGIRYAGQFKPSQEWAADPATLALYLFQEGQALILNDAANNKRHGQIVGAIWNKLEADPVGAARPEIAANPQRRAAEWVLARGGGVAVLPARGNSAPHVVGKYFIPASFQRGALTSYAVKKSLPDEDFALTGVWLDGQKVTADDLSQLGQTRLELLSVSSSQIDEAAMQEIGKQSDLLCLNLFQNAGVTNQSLKHLISLKRLQYLTLQRCSVGDVGMVHLRQMRSLEEINLADRSFSDAAVATLAELPALRTLYTTSVTGVFASSFSASKLKCLAVGTPYTPLSRAGMEAIASIKSLEELNLGDRSKAQPEWLSLLKNHPALKKLVVCGPVMTDEVIDHALGIPHLEELQIGLVEVAPARIDQLKKAKPQLKLFYSPPPKPAAPPSTGSK